MQRSVQCEKNTAPAPCAPTRHGSSQRCSIVRAMRTVCPAPQKPRCPPLRFAPQRRGQSVQRSSRSSKHIPPFYWIFAWKPPLPLTQSLFGRGALGDDSLLPPHPPPFSHKKAETARPSRLHVPNNRICDDAFTEERCPHRAPLLPHGYRKAAPYPSRILRAHSAARSRSCRLSRACAPRPTHRSACCAQ